MSGYIHFYRFTDGTTIEIYGRGFTMTELDMMVVAHGLVDEQKIIPVDIRRIDDGT